ncbi:MAG TPA: hypothetical protein PKD25_12720, partial [Rubrivivax sp.]|nr:hypothetical protein [Rubrivivax sp.]
MSSTSCAVVVTRADGWARLRVRGLLRKAALADELKRAGRGHVQVTVATGSVRVRLASARDEGYWLRWLAARIAAWPGGPGPALPPPSGARAAARGHGKSPSLPA